MRKTGRMSLGKERLEVVLAACRSGHILCRTIRDCRERWRLYPGGHPVSTIAARKAVRFLRREKDGLFEEDSQTWTAK